MEKKRSTRKEKRKIRVYSDGIFDLFHYGHMRMLEQVRKTFPDAEIVVGICSDEDTVKLKGNVVMSMKERAESLRHCKWIDEVIVNAPWIITKKFLEENRIDYVAHDSDPYPGEDKEDVYLEVKKLGMFVPTKRTEGISTSQLITRILSSYDKYMERNLDRGIGRDELNISLFTENRIKIGRYVEKMQEKMQKKVQKQGWYNRVSPMVVKRTIRITGMLFLAIAVWYLFFYLYQLGIIDKRRWPLDV